MGMLAFRSDEGAVAANRVALARQFDLDDLCAEPREVHACEGAREESGYGEHTYIFERLHVASG